MEGNEGEKCRITGKRIDFSLSAGMNLRGVEGAGWWKSPTSFILRAPSAL